MLGQHGPVARLDRGTEVRDDVEVRLDGHLAAEEEERMIEREEGPLRSQIRGRVEDVAAQRLDLAVDPLVDAVRAEVDPEIDIGKAALDFLADEEIVGIGMPVEEVEAAADAVVIRDRHEIHAPRLRRRIDLLGPRVAIERAQKPEMPGEAGMARVQVQIGAQESGLVCHSGFSSRICSTFEPAPR